MLSWEAQGAARQPEGVARQRTGEQVAHHDDDDDDGDDDDDDDDNYYDDDDVDVAHHDDDDDADDDSDNDVVGDDICNFSCRQCGGLKN